MCVVMCDENVEKLKNKNNILYDYNVYVPLVHLNQFHRANNLQKGLVDAPF